MADTSDECPPLLAAARDSALARLRDYPAPPSPPRVETPGDALAVTLTVEQLRTLMLDATSEGARQAVEHAGPPRAEPPYSVVQAAEFLGVSQRAIRDWIRDGTIRTAPKAGERVLIPASEIRRLSSVA